MHAGGLLGANGAVAGEHSQGEAAEAEASANLDLTKASTAANIASAEAGLELAIAALAQARAQLQQTLAEAAVIGEAADEVWTLVQRARLVVPRG